MSEILFDADGIEDALGRMAEALCGARADGPFAVVGIRTGGEFLAQRLAALIEKRREQKPPLGVVDVTLYRDDGFGPQEWPRVGVTHIPFRLKEYTVVLVDDVLYTGRTVRAALDAILDYGRPKAVRLAVLVDRGLRELPIGADVVGFTVATTAADHVDVRLRAAGNASDAVLVNKVGAGTEGAP